MPTHSPTSPTSAADASAGAERKDCGDELRRTFPALFQGGAKPLKLKIQADIQERVPGVFSKQQLSSFLRRYTGSTSYLIAMTRSSHRFDLDGHPSGEISDEHRQAAAEELARRRTQHQAKLQQIDEARRKRAALLRDFENTTLTAANFCALKGIAPHALDALLATARHEAEERSRSASAGTQRRDSRPPRGKDAAAAQRSDG